MESSWGVGWQVLPLRSSGGGVLGRLFVTAPPSVSRHSFAHARIYGEYSYKCETQSGLGFEVFFRMGFGMEFWSRLLLVEKDIVRVYRSRRLAPAEEFPDLDEDASLQYCEAVVTGREEIASQTIVGEAPAMTGLIQGFVACWFCAS